MGKNKNIIDPTCGYGLLGVRKKMKLLSEVLWSNEDMHTQISVQLLSAHSIHYQLL